MSSRFAKRTSVMTKREAEVERRMSLLIENFERYVSAFDEKPAFTKSEQLESHVATIKRRRELGDVSQAAADPMFLKFLYETLIAWGIGQRGSKLEPFHEFTRAINTCLPAMSDLDGMALENPALDIKLVAERVWALIESLDIVGNEAKLVPCTKALHHLLPDLVVPMDREFTRTFFGWHVPEFQYQQRKVFQHGFRHFIRIARIANPSEFVGGAGWRTSSTKVIDNAIVAFCRAESLPTPS